MRLNKLNKLQLLIFALFISLMLPLQQSIGGAWPQKKGTGFYKIHTGVCAHYRVEVEHLKKTCPQIGFGLIRPDEAIYVVTIPQH